ncbi:MAG: DUF2905 domain-containing protein [Ignavibacteria bacterium]|jgi:hypothetical protein|nr:DUF2905 domain-containing protein [Ignavibacteria bacterium]MDH7528826.1 DUF2905 domain-containing protein [Ignavibacteria bacterium]
MNLQKVFIIIGIGFLLIGFLFPYLSKLPLFRLPGDIVIEKPNFRFYFPITSMILLSILLSLIMWVIRKFFN